MKTLINKAANTVSGVALFTFGCVLAGISFAALGVLALFALAAMAVALLAAPFVGMARNASQDEAQTIDGVAAA